MNRDERRLFLYFSLLVAALLVLSGVLLRLWVATTLAADNKVHLAFLDLSLRDRSRFLGDTLSDQFERDHDWPHDLSDVLTRNHADFNRDIFMQVFDIRGDLIAQSANTPSVIRLAPGAIPEQGWKSHDYINTDGRPMRLVTYPIYTGLGTQAGITFHGYTQAGLSLPDTARKLNSFTWKMVVSLAGFGALFLIALRAAVLAAAARLSRETQLLQSAQHRFVADAAHELGTPLAVLRGEIDLALRRERPVEDYRQALTNCREEIERLSRLSENLLALATADAGQNLIHKAPCDAVVIARNVYKRFEHSAAEKGVNFLCELPASLSWEADSLAIEQILGNLVSNALRHTPSGESVTLLVMQKADILIISVADTGEGIPPSHLPRLFDRFHRVDKARSRHSGGAGLGLAIANTLVIAHGGTLCAKSELGKGSTFECRFPLTPAIQ